MKLPDDTIVVSGRLRVIAYAVCLDSSMPASDFIEGLNKADQRRALALFRRMADFGVIHNTRKFRHERNEIWGFKPTAQARIACFRIHNVWLLTHGFIKKGDKWPGSQLNRADRIRDEHIHQHN